MCACGLLFLFSLFWQMVASVSTGAKATPRRVETPYTTSLATAEKAIPKALDVIYSSLNQGNPAGARSLLVPRLSGSTEALDFICRPFTFRKYYVESIAGRPNERFLARVRVLFKPLDEHAHTMLFHITDQETTLESVEDSGDDWFGPLKAEAVDTVRRFLYAVKAGERDVAQKLVSDKFPFTECLDDEIIQDHLKGAREINAHGARIEQMHGIKLAVSVDFPECFGTSTTKVFFLDSLGGGLKIVRAFDNRHGWPDVCRWPVAYEDPDIERYTLRRFNLPGGEVRGDQ
jgi:hypothetical protein